MIIEKYLELNLLQENFYETISTIVIKEYNNNTQQNFYQDIAKQTYNSNNIEEIKNNSKKFQKEHIQSFLFDITQKFNNLL